METWIDVKGYEGIYSVSDKGNVKRLSKILFRESDGAYMTLPEKILKPGTDKKGYKHVVLTKNGKQLTTKIHRIVAMMFLEQGPFKKKMLEMRTSII